jgi:hypothetical protein
MAKKQGEKAESKSDARPESKRGRKLLAAARAHQDALVAAGLHVAVIEKFENSLRGLEGAGREVNAAAQTLVIEVQRVAGEYQVAIRKEFPSNTSFQAFFKADEPMPTDPFKVLALGREVARSAPDFQSNFIRYAINAATTKHLSYLCDQLEKELGGADPEKDAKETEVVILEVARRVFEGKPELAAFAK